MLTVPENGSPPPPAASCKEKGQLKGSLDGSDYDSLKRRHDERRGCRDSSPQRYMSFAQRSWESDLPLEAVKVAPVASSRAHLPGKAGGGAAQAALWGCAAGALQGQVQDTLEGGRADEGPPGPDHCTVPAPRA
eukprot:scaffold1974_cov395-Prasinococcus_capsulatus_cf.AAC.11